MKFLLTILLAALFAIGIRLHWGIRNGAVSYVDSRGYTHWPQYPSIHMWPDGTIAGINDDQPSESSAPSVVISGAVLCFSIVDGEEVAVDCPSTLPPEVSL